VENRRNDKENINENPENKGIKKIIYIIISKGD